MGAGDFDLLKAIEKGEIREVEVAWADHQGYPRGKRIPADVFVGRLDKGSMPFIIQTCRTLATRSRQGGFVLFLLDNFSPAFASQGEMNATLTLIMRARREGNNAGNGRSCGRGSLHNGAGRRGSSAFRLIGLGQVRPPEDRGNTANIFLRQCSLRAGSTMAASTAHSSSEWGLRCRGSRRRTRRTGSRLASSASQCLA